MSFFTQLARFVVAVMLECVLWVWSKVARLLWGEG